MAQKVRYIAVPVVQGEPDHVVSSVGVLQQEGGFSIARVSVDVSQAAAGRSYSFKQAGTGDGGVGY